MCFHVAFGFTVAPLDKALLAVYISAMCWSLAHFIAAEYIELSDHTIGVLVLSSFALLLAPFQLGNIRPKAIAGGL
jgi:hypothetical protein